VRLNGFATERPCETMCDVYESSTSINDSRRLVKDDIECGRGNAIPLWAFGLNY